MRILGTKGVQLEQARVTSIARQEETEGIKKGQLQGSIMVSTHEKTV